MGEPLTEDVPLFDLEPLPRRVAGASEAEPVPEWALAEASRLLREDPRLDRAMDALHADGMPYDDAAAFLLAAHLEGQDPEAMAGHLLKLRKQFRAIGAEAGRGAG